MARNSRWSDEPRLDKDGKPVVVSLMPHDYDIFALLSRYGMLRSHFIHALMGGDYSSLRDRLTKLNRKPNSYLEKPQPFEEQPNRNYQYLVYSLAARGWTALTNQGIPELHRRVVLNPGRGKYREFDHDLMISDILASFELSAKSLGLRFVSWQEVLERAPEATQQLEQPFRIELPISKTDKGKPKHLIPDAIFRIAYPNGDKELFQSFFVEIDRATMPAWRTDYSLSSLERKVLEYREVLDAAAPATQFNLKNVQVLIISTDQKQIDRIIARMKEKGLEDKRFHFLALPEFGRIGTSPKPKPDILQHPFSRAGHPASYLCDAFLKQRKDGETIWTSSEPTSSSQKSQSDKTNSPLSAL